jgi:exosortase F-associated protein
MSKKGVYIVLIVLALASVRLIGGRVFYDPLIAFFHIPDYQNYPLPEIEFWKFIGALVLRYAINSILTLSLVYIIFRKYDLVKLTTIIYALVFVVLVPLFLWWAWHAEPNQYRYLFYVRRILIHPILTLILIPALLYHDKGQKS